MKRNSPFNYGPNQDQILFHDGSEIKSGDLFLDENGDEILIDKVDHRSPQTISYIRNPKDLPKDKRYRKPFSMADDLIKRLTKRLN